MWKIIKNKNIAASWPFQGTLNLSAYFINRCLVVLCKFLGDFGYFGKAIDNFDLSKGRLNWGRYEMLKIWWIWKIAIWSEELADGYQTVSYQPGALIWGGQLSGSVSNPF